MSARWWYLWHARQRARAGKLPRWAQAYVRAQHGGNVPLSEVRFVVFDTETTGLNPKKDRIVEVGGVACRAFRLPMNDSLESYWRQASAGTRESISVHGLRTTDLQQGVPEAQGLQELIGWIGGDVLVAHNLWFDQGILDQTLRRYAPLRLLNVGLDTMHLARRLEDGRMSSTDHRIGHFTLDALCERYQVDTPARHTAAGDAYATAMLLIKLLRQAQAKGITTLKELL